MRKQQRHKDKQILRPLVRAQRFEDGLERPAAFLEYVCGDNAQRAHSHPQSQARIGYHRFGGTGQQRQIWSVVADVIEFIRAQPLAQAVELSDSGQVGCAIASQHPAEDP